MLLITITLFGSKSVVLSREVLFLTCSGHLLSNFDSTYGDGYVGLFVRWTYFTSIHNVHEATFNFDMNLSCDCLRCIWYWWFNT